MQPHREKCITLSAAERELAARRANRIGCEALLLRHGRSGETTLSSLGESWPALDLAGTRRNVVWYSCDRTVPGPRSGASAICCFVGTRPLGLVLTAIGRAPLRRWLSGTMQDYRHPMACLMTTCVWTFWRYGFMLLLCYVAAETQPSCASVWFMIISISRSNGKLAICPSLDSDSVLARQ